MKPAPTLAVFVVLLVLAAGGTAVAGTQGRGRSEALPYDGSVDDALSDAAAGATIPMSKYSIAAGKDGRTYSGTIVGANPAAATKATTKINVLIVPMIVHIGTTV